MSAKIDITGQRFGRLLVVSEAAPHIQPNGLKRTMWLCVCDCGEKYVAFGANLRNNHTQSCGCLQKDRAKESATTHGKAGSRIYRTWHHMLERCNNPSTRNYVGYGGRGIEVCAEWHTFEGFYKWAIKNGYTDKLTIDRIDNDGNYCPQNCRFISPAMQAGNKRTNRTIVANGCSHTVAQWARKMDIPYFTLLSRLNRGWDDERAVMTPSRPAQRGLA